MSKKMLINMVDVEESRVAIVDGKSLEDLYIESSEREQIKGNIYKGTIVSIIQSLQAVFVDYGGNRAGFLPIGEINPAYFIKKSNGSEKSASKGREQAPLKELIRPRQEVLVQVVKEEIGTKGASLTTFISLPGRFLVLMPGGDEVGISRRIEDEAERRRLRRFIDSFDVPEGTGLIVRTAGVGQTKTELTKDLNYLRRLWNSIQDAAARQRGPGLIYQERDIVTRAIRDHYTPDIKEIVVDNETVFARALEFLKTFTPRNQRILTLYEDPRPLFSHYDIERQIESALIRNVRLKAGGEIVIDTTEALVSIDVNSGRSTKEKSAEETAFRTNLEAAEEIATQLRLRDLGGLIVIDFIDMRDRKNARKVETCLRGALKKDKARIRVGRISQFGLLEMSRQRLRPAILDKHYLSCPRCKGIGRVKATETKALILMRKIRETCAQRRIERIRASLPVDVFTYIANRKREQLNQLEAEHGVTFEFRVRTGLDEQGFDPDCMEVIEARDKPEPVVPAPLLRAAELPVFPDLETPLEDSEEEEEDARAPDAAGKDAPSSRSRSSGRKPSSRRRHTSSLRSSRAGERASPEDDEASRPAPEKPIPSTRKESSPKKDGSSRRPRRRRSSGSDKERPAEAAPRESERELEIPLDPEERVRRSEEASAGSSHGDAESIGSSGPRRRRRGRRGGRGRSNRAAAEPHEGESGGEQASSSSPGGEALLEPASPSGSGEAASKSRSPRRRRGTRGSRRRRPSSSTPSSEPPSV